MTTTFADIIQAARRGEYLSSAETSDLPTRLPALRGPVAEQAASRLGKEIADILSRGIAELRCPTTSAAS